MPLFETSKCGVAFLMLTCHLCCASLRLPSLHLSTEAIVKFPCPTCDFKNLLDPEHVGKMRCFRLPRNISGQHKGSSGWLNGGVFREEARSRACQRLLQDATQKAVVALQESTPCFMHVKLHIPITLFCWI